MPCLKFTLFTVGKQEPGRVSDGYIKGYSRD
jgi:hypothetical protein